MTIFASGPGGNVKVNKNKTKQQKTQDIAHSTEFLMLCF